MKKLLVMSAATFILAATVNAQTTPASLKSEIKLDKKATANIKKEEREERRKLRMLNGNDVSYQSKEAFINDFDNLPVSQWERLDNFDKATFTKNEQVMSAYYDYDSKLVGTTSHKTFADIPAAAQNYINEKYQGYSKTDVIFFDDNELNETDMILYGDQFDDQDSYFVELKKGYKEIILQVNRIGTVSFFKQLQ